MNEMKSVLFLVAHQDDVEINVGGTISRFVRENEKRVITCVCARPELDERLEESETALKHLGVQDRFQFEDYKDTYLYQSTKNLVQDVDDIIRELKIDTIFTHHPGDAHQDHQVVSQVGAACSRMIDNLIYFRPTAPSCNTGIQFTHDLSIEVSKEDIQRKIEALRCHKSQLIKYGEEDWIERIKSIAEADSWVYSRRHSYAEIFEISKMAL